MAQILRKFQGYYLLFAVGVAFLAIRSILDSGFRNSTLLYLAIPFCLSILLHRLTPRLASQGVGSRYLNHLRDATIVFLATSALLFEGFICILMFMPIYYLAVTVAFVFVWLTERAGSSGGRARAYAIPAAVVLMCMEGFAEPLTPPRYRQATRVVETDQSIEQLKANMARPIVFPGGRHWFLQIFPLPDRVEAGTLNPGDVHTLHFTYKKWFFTNYSQGVMRIRIAEVGPARIRTEILENTAYLSHYMKIDGTEVRFTDLGGGRTRVALTVKYHRLLDPAWYFGPMEQFAAEESAEYLIESIIARHAA
jgi:hypothetical protein